MYLVLSAFTSSAAEDYVRIMGYDFRGRNFQEELRSSIPEDDIILPRNVGIRLPSDEALYARSTESAMSNLFYKMACQHYNVSKCMLLGSKGR